MRVPSSAIPKYFASQLCVFELVSKHLLCKFVVEMEHVTSIYVVTVYLEAPFFWSIFPLLPSQTLRPHRYLQMISFSVLVPSHQLLLSVSRLLWLCENWNVFLYQNLSADDNLMMVRGGGARREIYSHHIFSQTYKDLVVKGLIDWKSPG